MWIILIVPRIHKQFRSCSAEVIGAVIGCIRAVASAEPALPFGTELRREFSHPLDLPAGTNADAEVPRFPHHICHIRHFLLVIRFHLKRINIDVTIARIHAPIEHSEAVKQPGCIEGKRRRTRQGSKASQERIFQPAPADIFVCKFCGKFSAELIIGQHTEPNHVRALRWTVSMTVGPSDGGACGSTKPYLPVKIFRSKPGSRRRFRARRNRKGRFPSGPVGNVPRPRPKYIAADETPARAAQVGIAAANIHIRNMAVVDVKIGAVYRRMHYHAIDSSTDNLGNDSEQ